LQGLQSELSAKEANLRDIKVRLSETEESSDTAVDPNDIGSLKRQLADLLMRYTENHPDVMRLKSRIKELENSPLAGGKSGKLISSGLSRKKSELLRDQVALENQIANLQYQVEIYKARIEATPKREQELISLKRDYENMNSLYNNLLRRKLESEISVSMEKKQKGEQFQIIDRAQLPKRPIEPDLKRVFMLTLAVGFGLGCGLSFLLEILDSSYRRPEKVEDDFGLSVIATIPAIFSIKDIYKKHIELGLCGLFAFIILLLIGLFSFLTLGGNDQAFDVIKGYLSS
jgi:uncharacterized protein involved in exopolysaccharide biosynthesis